MPFSVLPGIPKICTVLAWGKKGEDNMEVKDIYNNAPVIDLILVTPEYVLTTR